MYEFDCNDPFPPQRTRMTKAQKAEREAARQKLWKERDDEYRETCKRLGKTPLPNPLLK